MKRFFPLGAATLLLTLPVGCAAIFGSLFAGVQISESQRVRSQEVMDLIRYQLPDPAVAEVVRATQKDVNGHPIAVEELALTLTAPTGSQFVALFIANGKRTEHKAKYIGYTVRGERYKGKWILERLLEDNRTVLHDVPPKEDYALYVFAKIHYFDSRLSTAPDPNFWDNSKPMFERLSPQELPPRYRGYAGEHKFVADGILKMMTARSETVTIKKQMLVKASIATSPAAATTFAAAPVSATVAIAAKSPVTTAAAAPTPISDPVATTTSVAPAVTATAATAIADPATTVTVAASAKAATLPETEPTPPDAEAPAIPMSQLPQHLEIGDR